MTQRGAVIVFHPRTDGLQQNMSNKMLENEINRALKHLLDPNYTVQIGEFNPEHGSPVFYVP